MNDATVRVPVSKIARPGRIRRRAEGLLARHGYTLLLLLVLAAESAVGLFVIRDLRAGNLEAQRMYAVSVRGLRRIGELQFQAQETRRSTLYALTTSDSNLQVEYADRSREADQLVGIGIAEYLKEAQTSSELEVGTRLQKDWAAYLRIRDEVLASILEGSAKEAVSRDISGGIPMFDRVRRDLEDVKRLYDEQASQRLAHVAATFHRSVVRLVAVLIFTMLFATLSVWMIQRSRMLAAVQLAKVQMDFVASVSHELRTPLAVVCSAAENLADGVVEGKDQLAKYGSVIRNQTHQITELVNQILLFASSREGKMRFMVRPLPVAQIVDTAVANTAQLVRDAGFVLEPHVPEGLPYVMGDLSALSRCLQNLVVNAIKYGGTDRWIGIRATHGGASQRNGHEVQISVLDHGIGIDPAELEQIFEPFYRSPAVFAAQIHGTGLGLPLAKSIAEAMGGRLSVTSELGKGSVFTLHLPAATDAQGSPGNLNSGPET
jgi:signal transduction histidine kinase